MPDDRIIGGSGAKLDRIHNPHRPEVKPDNPYLEGKKLLGPARAGSMPRVGGTTAYGKGHEKVFGERPNPNIAPTPEATSLELAIVLHIEKSETPPQKEDIVEALTPLDWTPNSIKGAVTRCIKKGLIIKLDDGLALMALGRKLAGEFGEFNVGQPES